MRDRFGRFVRGHAPLTDRDSVTGRFIPSEKRMKSGKNPRENFLKGKVCDSVTGRFIVANATIADRQELALAEPRITTSDIQESKPLREKPNVRKKLLKRRANDLNGDTLCRDVYDRVSSEVDELLKKLEEE